MILQELPTLTLTHSYPYESLIWQGQGKFPKAFSHILCTMLPNFPYMPQIVLLKFSVVLSDTCTA